MRLPLETEHLLIRPLETGDVEAVHAVWGDAEVARFLPTGPSASLEETAVRVRRHATRFAESGYGLCAVVERESDRVVGVCGLFPIEWIGPDVEVAYHFAREVWNRGYATEAARAWVDAGFEQLGLARVVALAYPGNRASIRVMEKVGMVFEREVERYGETLVEYAIERPA